MPNAISSATRITNGSIRDDPDYQDAVAQTEHLKTRLSKIVDTTDKES